MAHAPIVTLQLGQCGNQVGAAFFEQLFQLLCEDGSPAGASAASSSSNARGTQQQPAALKPVPPACYTPFQRGVASRFFRSARRQALRESQPSAIGSSTGSGVDEPLPVARAVLVDMEPKVIQHAFSAAGRSSSFAYDAKRSFFKQSGSGNNWAYGYSRHGTECREAILDLVRSEVEPLDSFGGMLVLQSLAGGTGSGLGAYVTEALSDTYPEANLMNAVVGPYAQGEVIVQNYNALLSLAHLHEYSSGIILFENDSLARICQRRMGMRNPSFSQMNKIIAEGLTHIVTPAQATGAFPFYACANEGTIPGDSSVSAATSSSLAKQDRGSGGSKTKHAPPPSDEDFLRFHPANHLWTDACSHLFAHPSFKLSTVRTIPQLSREAKSFSSASWRSLLKSLHLMGLQGKESDDGLDHSIVSYAMGELSSTRGSKQRFHRHYSSSARAAGLYDPHTMFDAPVIGSAAPSALIAAASAASAHSAPTASSPAASAALIGLSTFDAPLPAPSYAHAFRDGESYLEHRLGEQLHRRLVRNDSDAEDDAGLEPQRYNSSLAQSLFLRGRDVCSADARAFLDPSLYCGSSLNPLQVLRSPQVIGGDTRRATVWTNGQSVLPCLERIVGKVYNMLHARAYTHHYRKYGIEIEQMWQQLASMEQVCSDYKRLAFTSE